MKIKELRNCIICYFGTFTAKPNSKRKTCCTECSLEYAKQYRRDYYYKQKEVLAN